MASLEDTLRTAHVKDAHEAARELLITAGSALADTLRSITLPALVGTQLGGGDEPENYEEWPAEAVRPHLLDIVKGAAHTEQILKEVDAIRFPWEDRFADLAEGQVVREIGSHGRSEAEAIFKRHGYDVGAYTFFGYEGLTVTSDGRRARVRPVEPYLGAAKAYFDALEAYTDADNVDRYERVVAILRESVEWAKRAGKDQ